MRRKPRRTVPCACKCGTKLETPDSEGRERRFVSGHNGRKYRGRDAGNWPRQKRYRARHPEIIRVAKRRQHRARKVRAIHYLGDHCKHCGLRYNGVNAPVFEFHHRHPRYKKFSIGNLINNFTWPVIRRELDKCDLICANCHNQHHGGEW